MFFEFVRDNGEQIGGHLEFMHGEVYVKSALIRKTPEGKFRFLNYLFFYTNTLFG
jgi:hypothetical protein